MPPRIADKPRTTPTRNNPRRSGFMYTPADRVKRQYSTHQANCRLTPNGTLSMIETGPLEGSKERAKSIHAERSAHDRGFPGGPGGFWAPEAAGIGAELWKTDGGVPQGLKRLQKCVRGGDAGPRAAGAYRRAEEAGGGSERRCGCCDQRPRATGT